MMPRRTNANARSSGPDRSLAGQLRSAVRDSGESICGLAARAGLDRGMLGRFARGERDLSLASAGALASALGLKLSADSRKSRGRPWVTPKTGPAGPMDDSPAGPEFGDRRTHEHPSDTDDKSIDLPGSTSIDQSERRESPKFGRGHEIGQPEVNGPEASG